ncbi:MAG: hypothetical protein A2Y34_06950 [Spirochaetes bacterium GWC1_27_15]|nr:MAG: hypothetical protein A2Z98_01750 [Spirochaetes bacterium GWB1_27_13]OHD25586.1 MAG: hypothetical protein A2Y34_06950 [Spirochaetes bacterium GWC1_27_15]
MKILIVVILILFVLNILFPNSSLIIFTKNDSKINNNDSFLLKGIDITTKKVINIKIDRNVNNIIMDVEEGLYSYWELAIITKDIQEIKYAYNNSIPNLLIKKDCITLFSREYIFLDGYHGKPPFSVFNHDIIEFYLKEKDELNFENISKALLRLKSIYKLDLYNEIIVADKRIIKAKYVNLYESFFNKKVVKEDTPVIFKTYNNEIQLKDDVFYYFGDIVMSGTLVRDENIIINNFNYKFLSGWYISFYENGNIKEAVISDEQKINNVNLSSEEYVQFNEQGYLTKGVLGSDLNYRGELLIKGKEIEFYDSGRIKSGYIIDKFSVKTEKQNFDFSKHIKIQFPDN